MFRFLRYYGHYQQFRAGVGQMPSWARAIVTIVALPGILLIVLSILALCVSVLALLLLTAPVYRLLRAATATRMPLSDPFPGAMVSQGIQVDANTTVMDADAAAGAAAQPRRQVEVKIVE